MSYPRRVAKFIVEEGRIWEDLDLSAPFTKVEFNKRVTDVCQMMGMRSPVQPNHVMEEFHSAGLIEPITIDGNRYSRFKYKIGTVAELLSVAIGVKLDPRFEFGPDDFGPNESVLMGAKSWRGNSNRFRI
jgi:hypothetical protein